MPKFMFDPRAQKACFGPDMHAFITCNKKKYKTFFFLFFFSFLAIPNVSVIPMRGVSRQVCMKYDSLCFKFT